MRVTGSVGQYDLPGGSHHVGVTQFALPTLSPPLGQAAVTHKSERGSLRSISLSPFLRRHPQGRDWGAALSLAGALLGPLEDSGLTEKKRCEPDNHVWTKDGGELPTVTPGLPPLDDANWHLPSNLPCTWHFYLCAFVHPHSSADGSSPGSPAMALQPFQSSWCFQGLAEGIDKSNH